MVPRPVPGPLKKALDLLEADAARAWTVGEMASACGVGQRTLQRQFRQFIGRMPMTFLRDLRLDRARQEMLHASVGTTVTDVATRSGFNHIGRFAQQYRVRYGESPSATLSRNQRVPLGDTQRLPTSLAVERPAIAVLPFELDGHNARRAASISDEIRTALMRLRWLAVSIPVRARYHVCGRIRDIDAGRLQVTTTLLDVSAGRYVWADRWDGRCADLFELEERAVTRIAVAIEQSVRAAEMDRASRQAPAVSNAWELTMRALPRVLSVEAHAEMTALELLEQAMEKAPDDALPMAVAAWCHGLRGGHNFCPRPEQEKAAARDLAQRAAHLTAGDPLTETMLSAGYCLAGDFAPAAVHADRALALDGGSAWAWGRSGWIKAYAGDAAEAIERFQIARTLAPIDRMAFLCSVGIGVGYFSKAHYDESAPWLERALAENPAAVWINHTLAPAYALAGHKEDARRSFGNLIRIFPELTIAQVRSGLPHRAGFLDRIADGLESLGMRPS